jgi:hypothetical protein
MILAKTDHHMTYKILQYVQYRWYLAGVWHYAFAPRLCLVCQGPGLILTFS